MLTRTSLYKVFELAATLPLPKQAEFATALETKWKEMCNAWDNDNVALNTTQVQQVYDTLVN